MITSLQVSSNWRHTMEATTTLQPFRGATQVQTRDSSQSEPILQSRSGTHNQDKSFATSVGTQDEFRRYHGTNTVSQPEEKIQESFTMISDARILWFHAVSLTNKW
mmetsp:Transcript_22970/g.56600  ORF Transcript_22970/g.56600 Transcript_22970/m.56600 type:complete len:106 (-) Transcript_22970:627-944(-)